MHALTLVKVLKVSLSFLGEELNCRRQGRERERAQMNYFITSVRCECALEWSGASLRSITEEDSDKLTLKRGSK